MPGNNQERTENLARNLMERIQKIDESDIFDPGPPILWGDISRTVEPTIIRIKIKFWKSISSDDVPKIFIKIRLTWEEIIAGIPDPPKLTIKGDGDGLNFTEEAEYIY
jgi:hypothetical protein